MTEKKNVAAPLRSDRDHMRGTCANRIIHEGEDARGLPSSMRVAAVLIFAGVLPTAILAAILMILGVG